MCSPVLGDIYTKEYVIYTSGIKIGQLNWEVKITNQKYFNKLNLKSSGLLSTIYNFEGNYYSSGNIDGKKLIPKNYNHNWKTNKVNKTMELVFKNNKLKSLKQNPTEKEELRLNIYDFNFTKDPLSSFLQIVLGDESSLVVDGRRFYTMRALYKGFPNQIIIELINYSNLWTDHKKNNFEKIIFEKKGKDFLPSKIFIYFDGRVFRLI
jgi:hypothetical protein